MASLDMGAVVTDTAVVEVASGFRYVVGKAAAAEEAVEVVSVGVGAAVASLGTDQRPFGTGACSSTDRFQRRTAANTDTRQGAQRRTPRNRSTRAPMGRGDLESSGIVS